MRNKSQIDFAIQFHEALMMDNIVKSDAAKAVEHLQMSLALKWVLGQENAYGEVLAKAMDEARKDKAEQN